MRLLRRRSRTLATVRRGRTQTHRRLGAGFLPITRMWGGL